jgi:chromosome segregation ATPase
MADTTAEPVQQPPPSVESSADAISSDAPTVDQPQQPNVVINGVAETSGDGEFPVPPTASSSKVVDETTSSSAGKYLLHDIALETDDRISAALRAAKLQDKDLDIDRDYTTRLISTAGGFTSNVRENILTHPVVVKNRMDPTVSTHISAESRQVMRKGFDLGISSPGLRMLYDARIKELEEELDVEKAARNKAERQRAELQRELTSLAEHIDDSNEAARVQMEVNKRRDTDMLKLQRDLEEAQTQNEAQLATFRKKHQEAVNQLTEQMDQLHKVKQRIEKEKNQQRAEIDELRGQIDHLNKAKLTSEKLNKQLEAQLSEASTKIAELQREIHDVTSHKNRLLQEQSDVMHRLDETANQLDQANKAKLALGRQLEEAKMAVEDEACVRNKVLGDNRNLQAVIDQLREQLDEEQEGRAELQRQLTRANNEAAVWRQKFESGEGGIRPEELDDLKKKLGARILDGEAQLEAAMAKAIGLEKAKSRSQMEIDALVAEVEKCQAIIAQHEKRQRQFDKLVDEWKKKVTDLQSELDNSQKESRVNAAEAYKYKAQLDETQEVIEALRRENKNLSDEIHDLTDQISQGNHRLQEMEKVSKRFEAERDELQATLEEAEAALEQEEAKVDRAFMDVAAVKEEMERRLMEKDEEFENTRKNHQRALDSMQINLETEARSKIEALRIKKKLEQDINDLEMTLDGANKAKAETEKNLKKYQQQIRDLQQLLDEEQRSRQSIRDEITASERRNALLGGEIEELRAQIDVLEKTRKMAEGELHEATDRISDLTATNSSLMATKKKLEADMQALHGDFEEQVNELRLAEDQTKKAMADAARLAEELRQEQDHAGQIEKLRRGLEVQVKELQQRVDEAEAAALHGGRKTIQKLEQRIRELEVELEAEQHRHADTQKSQRKHERRMQELTLQLDEDHKGQERMRDMIEKLQQKMKQYKRQVEEAEEIAAINLTKYRKMQHDLEEAEARAEMAENVLGQMRAKGRTSMSVTETASPYSGIVIKSTTTRTQNISSDIKHDV